jgi:hypothetical protein
MPIESHAHPQHSTLDCIRERERKKEKAFILIISPILWFHRLSTYSSSSSSFGAGENNKKVR